MPETTLETPRMQKKAAEQVLHKGVRFQQTEQRRLQAPVEQQQTLKNDDPSQTVESQTHPPSEIAEFSSTGQKTAVEPTAEGSARFLHMVRPKAKSNPFNRALQIDKETADGISDDSSDEKSARVSRLDNFSTFNKSFALPRSNTWGERGVLQSEQSKSFVLPRSNTWGERESPNLLSTQIAEIPSESHLCMEELK